MRKALMEKTPAFKVLSYRWFIFCLLAFAYVLVYFHRFAISVVAVDIEKTFRTSARLMGILGSAYFYCYALMQFPAGLISDTLGPRKGVTFFLGIASVGSILFGLSQSIEISILSRILVGLGVSMVFIPTMKILSQWYRASEFSFMAGIMNAMGGVGMLVSAAPLAMMSSSFGWRFPFLLIGIITSIVALLSWVIVRDRPSDMGWPPIAQIERRERGALKEDKLVTIPLWQGVKRVITQRYFWPVALWFFLDCGIFFGFGALWSGPYLMHVYRMTQSEAGFILSMIAVGMIGGSPIISILSDKVLRSRKRVLMLSSAGLMLTMLSLTLKPAGFTTPILLIIFLIFSVCSSAIVVIGFTTTKELFPVEIAGTSVGTVNLFPFLGGAVFQPILGIILDLYPKTESMGYSLKAYSALLFVLFITSIFTLACTFFMKETYNEVIS